MISGKKCLLISIYSLILLKSILLHVLGCLDSLKEEVGRNIRGCCGEGRDRILPSQALPTNAVFFQWSSQVQGSQEGRAHGAGCTGVRGAHVSWRDRE